MPRSFKIGKLFGIPLYIHTTFFLLPAWLLLTNGGHGLANALFLLLGLAGVFTCVVLHELGHALMARYFGIDTGSITLYPIGGVARLERMSEKPSEEICIALAGPAVNLAIAALLTPAAVLSLLGMRLTPIIGQFVFLFLSANIWLLIFNLLPCFPMDGGRVLRALLAIRKGQLRATEIAVRVGLVMAVLIAALSLLTYSPMPLVVAAFVYFAGQMELMALRQREAKRRAALLVEPIPQPELVTVPLEESPFGSAPFTGVAWDPRYRVWVRWHHGRPVAFWG
jgi:Zn-dependent protease